MTEEDLIKLMEPRLASAFVEAVKNIRDRQDINELAELIKANRIDDALRLLGISDLDFQPLRAEIDNAFRQGGTIASGTVQASMEALGFAFLNRFDFYNVRAEMWLKQHGASLVTAISDDQKELIRDQLISGLNLGENPRKIALDIVGRIDRITNRREGGIIGLTEEQGKWLTNYRAELLGVGTPKGIGNALDRNLVTENEKNLISRADRSGRPLDARVVDRLLAAYKNRALRFRAETISRTEVLQALSRSRWEAYKQAADSGAVKPEKIKRFWSVVNDSRLRHSHSVIPGMNEGGVGLDQYYETPYGSMLYPGDPTAPFAAIVNCRCTEIIRISA